MQTHCKKCDRLPVFLHKEKSEPTPKGKKELNCLKTFWLSLNLYRQYAFFSYLFSTFTLTYWRKRRKKKKSNTVYPNIPFLANRPFRAHNLFDCEQKSMLSVIGFISGRTGYCHIIWQVCVHNLWNKKCFLLGIYQYSCPSYIFLENPLFVPYRESLTETEDYFKSLKFIQNHIKLEGMLF